VPNGTDCSNILQTEAICVPTQWFIVDCTKEGRIAPWLKADLSGEIDYFHCDGLCDPHAGFQQLRPNVLHALLDAYHRRKAEGSRGRLVVWVIADLSEPLGNLLLAQLPLDIANLMFWESHLVPVVIRAGIDGTAEDRRRYLSCIRDQYFGLPDFSRPYYGKHTPGQIYGNEFDSTLLSPNDAGLRNIVEHLVTLHLAETRFAKSHLQRNSRGGILVIEQVMKESLRWRKIDWLAATSYPFFKRLWNTEREDILDLLDYSRCPARQQNPWATLQGRSREKNWNDLDLDPVKSDPLVGQSPYRVSPGDHRTRLALAHFLLSHRLYEDVLAQCKVAQDEGGYRASDQWLKIEGLAQRGVGKDSESRKLFGQYREKLEADPSPTAQTFDEIASMALMERDFRSAFDSALKAVKRDRFLTHAYDAMVLAGRESGDPSFEKQAIELAKDNGVAIPIHVRERTAQVMKGAKVSEVKPQPPAAKKWWKFW
jgi:hypothetical protein